jgi:glycerol-3-phosphate dehydrogenase
MPEFEHVYDLAIIGGGINGAGIARDAAGRGLSVLLVEADDLAGATSSASSKLIHGGLRYLEYMEFRLVREALAEREVLKSIAPHMVTPMRFVLPHVPAMRPRPLIRLGLFLYDHLASRQTIPGSTSIDLAAAPAGAPLQDAYRHGFTYFDCWVDDARLVVTNARAAAEAGAEVRTRTRCTGAQRHAEHWHLQLRDEATGETLEAAARGLVNAAGPWVGQVAAGTDTGNGKAPGGGMRLVKGSHIVVPRLAGSSGEDAYILQNHDRRVVFVLPFEEHFSLIGTTDIPYDGDAKEACIDEAETRYLLDAVGRFVKRPPTAADIVWSFSGVRPLYDDNGSASASAVTRDYRLELDDGDGKPPLLTVMGGKLTTYRRLAEEAVKKLTPGLKVRQGAWTSAAALPGGDLPASDFAAFVDGLARQYERWDRRVIAGLARRHGSRVEDVIGDARDLQGMGRQIGGDLYEREVHYMSANEWARKPEDILWRRTKAGVHLSPDERRLALDAVGAML